MRDVRLERVLAKVRKNVAQYVVNDATAKVAYLPSRQTTGFVVGEFIAIGISVPVFLFGQNPIPALVAYSIIMAIWLLYPNIKRRPQQTAFIRELIANGLFCFWFEIYPLWLFFSVALDKAQSDPPYAKALTLISIPITFFVLLKLVTGVRRIIAAHTAETRFKTRPADE